MASYRKKPVVIQAFRLGHDSEPDWWTDAPNIISGVMYCDIQTLEGTMRAENGDFVIQGVKGELYPCKPDIFEATYEPA